MSNYFVIIAQKIFKTANAGNWKLHVILGTRFSKLKVFSCKHSKCQRSLFRFLILYGTWNWFPASDSENESYQTDDSEYNYIPGPHLIDEPTEVEEAVGSPNMVNMGAEEPNVGPTGRENKVMTNVFEFYKIDLREMKTCL